MRESGGAAIGGNQGGACLSRTPEVHQQAHERFVPSARVSGNRARYVPPSRMDMPQTPSPKGVQAHGNVFGIN